MKKMPLRYRAFIREYLTDPNGKQAAIAAGYSKKTAESQASRLLRNVKVAAAIEDGMKKKEDEALVTTAEVIKDIKEVKNRCMTAKPVMVREGKRMVQKIDPDTGEGVWEFDSAGANGALRMLGQYLAMFTEKFDGTIREPEPIHFIRAKSNNASGRGN